MSKITAYGALSSPTANDELPIVDVNDPTMAPSGTTKNITVANLLAYLLAVANSWTANQTFSTIEIANTGGTISGANAGLDQPFAGIFRLYTNVASGNIQIVAENGEITLFAWRHRDGLLRHVRPVPRDRRRQRAPGRNHHERHHGPAEQRRQQLRVDVPRQPQSAAG